MTTPRAWPSHRAGTVTVAGRKSAHDRASLADHSVRHSVCLARLVAQHFPMERESMFTPRIAVLSLAALLAISPFAASAQQASRNGVLVRNDGIYLRCDQCGTVESIDQNITQGND